MHYILKAIPSDLKKKNKNLLYSYFQLINFALCSDDFTQKFLTFFTKNNKMLKQDYTSLKKQCEMEKKRFSNSDFSFSDFLYG